jgi:putative FmdB family regulatory protein
MPVYEYACDKCGHEFEAEQRISDDPIRTCPKCRARKVKRLISRTSFVLKGSGWYSDLYSSPGKKSEETGDAKSGGESGTEKVAASDAKSDTNAEAKSESKSEAKSDSKSDSKAGAKADSKPKGKAKGKSKAA